jgi:hypothetical protein
LGVVWARALGFHRQVASVKESELELELVSVSELVLELALVLALVLASKQRLHTPQIRIPVLQWSPYWL